MEICAFFYSSKLAKLYLTLFFFFKGLVAGCHSFCLFWFYNIHTFIQSQYIHPSSFAEASLHFLIACVLSGENFPVVPSRESNSGLPYSKPTRCQLSHAAPCLIVDQIQKSSRNFRPKNHLTLLLLYVPPALPMGCSAILYELLAIPAAAAAGILLNVHKTPTWPKLRKEGCDRLSVLTAPWLYGTPMDTKP
jgi:hypothetical protein